MNESNKASEKIYDGGPAFPNPNYQDNSIRGMSLRDYFAGQTLVGIMTTQKDYEAEINYATASECCYMIADAMLKAREAKQ